jgi:endonuclease/exonuclease/phosphatase family metal-dependent hydrolase
MGADVVALQEVAPECIPNLEREFAREYPHRFFGGSQGLLSRTPMIGARYEKSKAGGNGFIVAEVEHGKKRVQVANLHLDPLRCWSTKEKLLLPLQIRRQARVQEEELGQVRAMLKPGIPTLLMGDFNRVGDGAIHRLQSDGYTDSFAVVTPHPDRTSTLHFDVLGITAGKRIDFIFHDSAFRTVGSRVCAGHPSDHDAVTSQLRLERKL